MIAGVSLFSGDRKKDSPRDSFREAVTRTLKAYNQDTARACRLHPSDFRGSAAERKDLKKMAATLEQSEEGRAILAGAKKGDISMAMDSTSRFNGYLNAQSGALNINPVRISKTPGMAINISSHELSHSAQRGRGLMETEGMSIPDRLMQPRLLEADADARMVQTAREIKEKGNPDPWKALPAEGSPHAALATACEASVKKDPANVKNGTAMRAVFDARFKDKDRVTRYDMKLLTSVSYQLRGREAGKDLKKFDGGRSLKPVAVKLGQRRDGSTCLGRLAGELTRESAPLHTRKDRHHVPVL